MGLNMGYFFGLRIGTWMLRRSLLLVVLGLLVLGVSLGAAPTTRVPDRASLNCRYDVGCTSVRNILQTVFGNVALP